MRKLPVFFLLLLFFHFSYAQKIPVKGSVIDTIENKKLQNATVSILNKADSVLVTFGRTGADGSFHINNIDTGQYVIFVSYPKYADYMESFSVSPADKNIDFKAISLVPVSKLLEAVVIHSYGAIRIKGDTTEFVADSFKVREGATVEELMKQLPGITVNSKGEITAQGKKVDKVLVDGEEFFGDDPTMATQNLAAKAVDKIQVYDTKSEQQQLTGITTGNEGKTVNIQLKDNAKKGYFGKAEAATNFDKLHDGKLMLNRFAGKQKFSVYGIKSNTSTGNLNWDEQRKLGAEDDYEFDEINGYWYSYGGSDEFSDWNLRGLPDAYSAGSVFINKWNQDKQAINLSYKYNRLGTVNRMSTLTQTLLADTTYYNNQYTRANGLNQQHAVTAKYEWKLDSLSSIKYTGSGTYKSNNTQTNVISSALNEDKEFVNSSDRTNTTDATTKKMDNLITYKRDFKKKDRKLIATFRYGIDDINSDGGLLATNQYYKYGILDSTEIIDQLKSTVGHSETYGGKITYSEPLSVNWSLITEYSYYKNNATADKNTFEKDNNGKYSVLNPVYSNNFDFDASSNTGNVIFKYTSRKLNMSAGSGLSSIKLNLFNKDNLQKNTFNFLNVTPQVQARYNLKAQTAIRIGYRGSTRQPSINQLQPLQDNNDPLNVYVGNPDLKVGFSHNLNLGYNSFKTLSQRYIFGNASINFLSNAITTTSTIDQFGKRVYKPVNVNGNYNWNLYADMYKESAENKLNKSFGVQMNGGRNINFINGERNENNYATLSANFGVGKYKKDKYNFQVRPQLARNLSKSSLRKDVNNNYWSYGGEIWGEVTLPWNLEISTNLEADLRQKLEVFNQSNNITVWNMNVTRSFFKKKNLKLIFSAHDILNQNKGFERTINSSFISDNSYLKLGRYFMLGLQWSFTNTPLDK